MKKLLTLCFMFFFTLSISGCGQINADAIFADKYLKPISKSQKISADSLQGCAWKDTMDPAAASNDPGRGLSNWKAHYDHVMIQDGLNNVSKLISNRLQTLSLCLSNDSYARLYADISVLIAKVGNEKAGWRNAMDAAAPSQDPGRGLFDWQLHYKHCLGSGRNNVHVLVGERLSSLKNAISKEAYAKLYADASVLIAKYGRA